jgi:hypothetical protein
MVEIKINLLVKMMTVGVPLFAAGCTTMFQPNITIKSPTAAGDAKITYHGELNASISQAESLREGYEGAIRDQAFARTGIADFLLGAGAGALAIGASGGHVAHSALLGLGLGGAAAYTAGSSFISPARVEIYKTAINKVDCDLNATLPFRMTDAQYDRLQSTIGVLGKDIDAVTNASSPASADLVRSARATQDALTELSIKVDAAGFALRNQLHDLNAWVGSQLDKTEPDFSKLPQTLSGLGATAASIAPGVKLPPAQTGNTLQAGHGDEVEIAPTQAELALRQEVVVAQAFLDEAKARARIGGDATKCNASTLRLGIQNSAIYLHPGDKYDNPVLASKSRVPTISPAAGPSAGVTVAPETVGTGVVIRVTVDANAPNALWTVDVVDPEGDGEQSFTIDVRSEGSQKKKANKQRKAPTFESDRALVGLLPKDAASPDDPKFKTRVKWLSGVCEQDTNPTEQMTTKLRDWLSTREKVGLAIDENAEPPKRDCPPAKGQPAANDTTGRGPPAAGAGGAGNGGQSPPSQ